MLIRKFVIGLVVKYSSKGFTDAEKDMKKVRAEAKQLARELKALNKVQGQTAKTSRKVATASRKVATSSEKASSALSKQEKEYKRLRKEIGKSEASILRLDRQISRTNKTLADSGGFKNFGSSIGQLGPLAAGAGRAITGMMAGLAVVGAGVIKVGGDFESLRAQLNLLLGSEAAGAGAFKGIQDFAKNTPFQVQGITSSFIKLQNQGIKPTEERLTAFGDIAAANGKELSDITEAVLDAAVGENERLKEFGIKANATGKLLKLSFRGQTFEIEKNKDAITEALVAIGKMKGISGSMAAQMVTTKGVISNLTDGFFSFIDQIAQLGVLEEFKALLGDIAGAGGPGLASVIAKGLVSALKSVRTALASITKEQIRSFLEGVSSAMSTLGKIIELAAAALQVFIEMSGDAASALDNMAIAVFALAAAFQGPAGLAVAAAAAGVVLGRMLANLATDLDGTNERIATLDKRIAGLRANIAKAEANIVASETRISKKQQELADKRDEIRKQQAAKVKKIAGGAGAGLRRELSEEDAGFRATQIISGTAEQQAQGRAELLTQEGQQVVAAVDAAQRKVADAAEATARKEAKRSGLTGAQVTQSGKSARAAAAAAAASQREKALTKATTEFGRTGSAKAAAAAGVGVIAGKKKKGKKGPADPFDFEGKAEKAATSQAQEFAEREVERLVESGVGSGEAIKQAAEAGRERQKELTAKFLEAGKIFSADTGNILDILGLRGPGSMLEGRAPPTSLIISPHFEINMIKEFIQTNELSGGAKELAEITGAGGEAAVNAGLDRFVPIVEKQVMATLKLQFGRLLKMDGGGELPSGPEG